MKAAWVVWVLVGLAVAGCAGGDKDDDGATSDPTPSATEGPRESETAASNIEAANVTVDSFPVPMPAKIEFPPTGDRDLRRMRVAFDRPWHWGAMTFDDVGSNQLGFLIVPFDEVPAFGSGCGKATPPQSLSREVGSASLAGFSGGAGAYDLWYWNTDTAALRVEYLGPDDTAATNVVTPPANATGWTSAAKVGKYSFDLTAPLAGSFAGTVTTSGPSWVQVTAATPLGLESTARAVVADPVGTICHEQSVVGGSLQAGGLSIAWAQASVGAGAWSWSASYEGGRPAVVPRLDDQPASVLVVGPAPITLS